MKKVFFKGFAKLKTHVKTNIVALGEGLVWIQFF